MRKATREFLKLNTSARFVEVQLIEVDGTKPNHCYENSCLYADRNPKDLIVLSGWLIGEFLSAELGTAIIPHYWVVNEITKKHFDPTPKNFNDKQSYEYVVDMNIFKYGNEKSILPLPLRLNANGKFQVKLDNGTFIDLDTINIAEIYALRSS